MSSTPVPLDTPTPHEVDRELGRLWAAYVPERLQPLLKRLRTETAAFKVATLEDLGAKQLMLNFDPTPRKPWDPIKHPRGWRGRWLDLGGDKPEPGKYKTVVSRDAQGTLRDNEDVLELSWHYQESWGHDLTPEQQNAFADYTAAGYQDINGYLRKGAANYYSYVMNEHSAVYDIQQMDTALAMPGAATPQDIMVYRAGQVEDENGNDLWSKGEILQDDGFVSTSLDAGIAWGFETHGTRERLFAIEVPAGSPAAFSQNMGELEMILPRGARFTRMGDVEVGIPQWDQQTFEYKGLKRKKVPRLRYLGSESTPVTFAKAAPVKAKDAEGAPSRFCWQPGDLRRLRTETPTHYSRTVFSRTASFGVMMPDKLTLPKPVKHKLKPWVYGKFDVYEESKHPRDWHGRWVALGGAKATAEKYLQGTIEATKDYPEDDPMVGEYAEWQDGLTPEQSDALSQYQDTAFIDINRYLRKGKTDRNSTYSEGQLTMLVGEIDAALAKPTARVGTDTMVFRKGRLKDEDGNEIWSPGEILQDDGFVSTSLDPDIAADFEANGELIAIELPKGSHAGYIPDTGEREMLLPRGAHLTRMGSLTIDTVDSHNDQAGPVKRTIPRLRYLGSGKEAKFSSRLRAETPAAGAETPDRFTWQPGDVKRVPFDEAKHPRGFHGKWVAKGTGGTPPPAQAGVTPQNDTGATESHGEARKPQDGIEYTAHGVSHVPGRPTADHVNAASILPVEEYNAQDASMAQYAAEYGFTQEEYERAALEQLTMLTRKARVVRRMSPENVPRVLESGRFKTAFHSGIDQAMQDPETYREYEDLLWGYPWQQDIDPDLRPIFAYLTDDPDTEVPDSSYLWDYGSVAVVLKDRVRPRTTFALHDSNGWINSGFQMGSATATTAPLNEPNILVYAHEGLDILEVDHIQDVPWKASDNMTFAYAEAQVHEGVTLDDVDYFVFTETPNEELQEQLKQAGVKWKMAKPKKTDPKEVGMLNVRAVRGEGGYDPDYDPHDDPPPIVRDEEADRAAHEAWNREWEKEKQEAGVPFSIPSPYGDAGLSVTVTSDERNLAVFFSPLQQRDNKGRWVDEGKGRQMQSGIREPGGPTPGLTPDEETELHTQVAQVMQSRRASAFDMTAMQRVAHEMDLGLLTDTLDYITPANWFSMLVDASDTVSTAMGGPAGEAELYDDPILAGDLDDPEQVVHINLGITPFRGKPAEDVKSTEAYYGTTRYRGWLTDLRTEAHRSGVQVQDVVKITGVWQGSVEPSASVWVKGNAKGVKQFAASMGAEYNQDGVMVFEPDRDDGQGALYTMPGLQEADRERAIKAMTTAGVEGGRIVSMRDGGFALEVADMDGSLLSAVEQLHTTLGTDLLATPGRVSVLSAGTDYDRKSRPARGRGVTHGVQRKSPARAAAAAFASYFSRATGATDKAQEPRKGWDRDGEWATRGWKVHKAPRGHALVSMRGGMSLMPYDSGDPVEVYTQDKTWQGTTASGERLVCLRGPYSAGMGQDNEGDMVVLVGTEGAHAIRGMGLEGQEVPADLVRKAGGKLSGPSKSTPGAGPARKPSPHGDATGGKGKTAAFAMTVDWELIGRETDEQTARRAYFATPFGSGHLVSAPGKPNIHFNPLQLRDPEGRWVDTGKSRKRYQRELAAVDGDEGLLVSADPRARLGTTPSQRAGRVFVFPTRDQMASAADKLARYNATPKEMEAHIRSVVSRVSQENRKRWRTWYYDTADLAERMAEATGTNFTQAAMALAALSPQVLWGYKKIATAPAGRTTNQSEAVFALAMVGNRSTEVVNITPEFAKKFREELGVNLQAYDGPDFTVTPGGNYLGEHQVADLPADVVSYAYHDEHHAIDENMTKAIMLGRTQDPDILGGPKTRSFYNNIRFPETSQDATIDVFMARILTGHRDLTDEELGDITNSVAVYMPQSEAIQRVARSMGWKPHELQAVVWIQEHLDAAQSTDPSTTPQDVYDNPKKIQHDATTAHRRQVRRRQEAINAARTREGLPPIEWLRPDGKKDPAALKAWKAAGGYHTGWWRGKFWINNFDALQTDEEPDAPVTKKTKARGGKR